MDTSANLILAWPWALLLLGLPWLLRGWLVHGWFKRLLPPRKFSAATAALRLPLQALPAFATSPQQLASRYRPDWRSLIWLLLVLALARPEWQQESIEFPRQTRQLMLVVDISGSMNELMQGRTRLDQVKQVVRSFLAERPDDRVGLVVFGGQSYLFVPLTLDHDLLLHQLQGMQPGMAGSGTAIGDALGVAIRSLNQSEGDGAILLLTDGASNAGQLTPNQSLAMARDAGIRTHLVVVDLNPEPEISRAIRQTGGEVFSAFSRRELEQVYERINQLEPVTRMERFTPAKPLMHWLLLAALLLALWVIWRQRSRQA